MTRLCRGSRPEAWCLSDREGGWLSFPTLHRWWKSFSDENAYFDTDTLCGEGARGFHRPRGEEADESPWCCTNLRKASFWLWVDCL